MQLIKILSMAILCAVQCPRTAPLFAPTDTHGFNVGASASWWKPSKEPSGAKVDGDRVYLTEVFRSQIFEPIVTKILGSLRHLTAEIYKQGNFDYAIIICAAAPTIALTIFVVVTLYHKYFTLKTSKSL